MGLASLAVLGFVVGAVAGSFLATILIRWPQSISVVRGRSRCDSCGRPLRPLELIPLVSLLFLHGRCNHCGAEIDVRHVAIELTAAVMGAIALAAFPGPIGITSALLGWSLLLVAALDVEHHWLPDRLTLPLGLCGLLVGAIGLGPLFGDRLAGVVAGFLSLSLIRMAYHLLRGREGMGSGDPKLFAALGAWLGYQQLPILLLSAGLLGLVAAILPHWGHGRLSRDSRLPLGSFLAIVAWPIWILTV